MSTTSQSLAGVTPVAGDILVKYTWGGDANLDGKVDNNDVSIMNGFYDPALPPIDPGDDAGSEAGGASEAIGTADDDSIIVQRKPTPNDEAQGLFATQAQVWD